MKDELKYNIVNYLNRNNKKQILISIFITIILILIIIFSFKYKLYNIEKINAQTVCEENKCMIDFYHNHIIKEEYNYIKIKDEKYSIENIDFFDPEIDNQNNMFQKVTVNLKNYKGKNNEIIEIKIYKNKETLIKKIWKIIVER